MQKLFETPTLARVSAEELRQMAAEHPYYGTAHFLLAKKLYQSKEAGFEQALQKAALYFPNELWLQFNLTAEEDSIDSTPVELIPEKTEIIKEQHPVDETLQAEKADELDAGEEDIFLEELTEDLILNEKLSSLLQEQAAEFEKPVEPSAEITPEITPYHRVDYFDSQGIKLEEEKADDKLGTQLKRFTDWLKQMKRINPNPVQLGSDEAGENQVQNIAAHSNEPEDVVTEAMAEVLIKQGKPQQAIDIYEKLSFNNPSKSAYFAAKIKELKS